MSIVLKRRAIHSMVVSDPLVYHYCTPAGKPLLAIARHVHSFPPAKWFYCTRTTAWSVHACIQHHMWSCRLWHYACRDVTNGFQLYQSDPSGNYGGWKATAIGANSQGAQNILKQDFKDEITLEEAVKLIIKVISRTSFHTSCNASS